MIKELDTRVGSVVGEWEFSRMSLKMVVIFNPQACQDKRGRDTFLSKGFQEMWKILMGYGKVP